MSGNIKFRWFLLAPIVLALLVVVTSAGAENEYYVGFKTNPSIQHYPDVGFVNPGITPFEVERAKTFTSLQRIEVVSERLMLNGYYDLKELKIPTMYLSVGVGVVSNSTDATQGVSFEFIDVTSIDFAWSLGTGFSKNLSDSLTTDLRYRYVDLGKAGTRMSEFSPYDEHFESKLDTHEVTFGIRANF